MFLFCFGKKENNTLLTRDKLLDAYIIELWTDLWWFVSHFHSNVKKQLEILSRDIGQRFKDFLKLQFIRRPLPTNVYKLKNNYLSHRRNKLFRELKTKHEKNFYSFIFLALPFFLHLYAKRLQGKPKGKNNGKFLPRVCRRNDNENTLFAFVEKIIFHQKKKNANGSKKYVLGEKKRNDGGIFQRKMYLRSCGKKKSREIYVYERVVRVLGVGGDLCIIR